MKYFWISLFLHGLALFIIGYGIRFQDVEPAAPDYEIDLNFSSQKEISQLKRSSQKLKKKIPQKRTKKIAEEGRRKSLDQKQETLPDPSSTPSGRKAKLTYLDLLHLYIKEQDYYPPIALRLRQSGTVVVKLTIAKNGDFLAVNISKASAHQSLNEGTLDLIRGLKSFKPLPYDKEQENFIIPISYTL